MPPCNRLFAALAASLVTVASLALGANPAAADTTYVVEPGDTLSVIAADHGVSTAELADANGITNRHLIRVGQSLTVPTPEPSFHTVEAGDSLGAIAATYGVSVSDLVAVNGLSDPNRIRIGQQLQLPSEAQAQAVAGPSSELDSIAARYPNLPDRILSNPDRLALVPSFERWAAHYDVPADLVMAVAYQESGWQRTVVSNKGAIGIGQLLPATAEWIATDLVGIPELDPTVADDNIRMSTRFLLWLLGYLGSEREALAGYYQGPTSLVLRGMYGETVVYVDAVEGGRWRFQQG